MRFADRLIMDNQQIQQKLHQAEAQLCNVQRDCSQMRVRHTELMSESQELTG